MKKLQDAQEFLIQLCSRNLRDRREWLGQRLRTTFGDRLSVQVSASTAHFGDCGSTTNFLVKFGDHPEQLVVGAHYDVVGREDEDPRSAHFVPGANDNGAAVVQLFFAAEAILHGSFTPNVTFVFFDHEEWFGSPDMGSNRFLENNPAPELAIILDVTGIGDLYWSTSQTSLEESWHKSLLSGLQGRSTPPSDSMNFIAQKIPTVLLCCLPKTKMREACPAEWGYLHCADDSLASITPQALTDVTTWLTNAIYRAHFIRNSASKRKSVDTSSETAYSITEDKG